MSHLKIEVTKSVIRKLEDKFGKMSSMCYRLECDFLGMKFFFAEDKRAGIDAREYLRKAVDVFGEDNLKGVAIPDRSNLQNIDKTSPVVGKEDRRKFNSIVMLLMCPSCRGRRDLLPAVTFLSTSVNMCAKEDCKKLCRLMWCIIRSMNELMYLGATN